MKKLVFAALAVIVAAPALSVTVYTDKASFLAATTATKTGIPDTSNELTPDPVTIGAVTFTSFGAGGQQVFDDGFYGANVAYLEGDPIFVISSTTRALGLDLGSFDEPFTVSYTIGSISGTFDLPATNSGPFVGSGNTTFIGFVDSSPISVTLDGRNGIDVTYFYACEAKSTTSPLPEPESWAMMVAGFGLAGAAMRRRKATVRFA